MGMGLSYASWACFALAFAMLHAPSPLLPVLVPAHFLLALAAFFATGVPRRVLWANAATMCASFAFLFAQTFLR